MLDQYPFKSDVIQLLYSYVLRVGLDSHNVDGESVNEDYCQLIFSVILKDYKEQKLSPEDLSALCELMWQKCKRYSDVLLEGAEVAWYLRNNPPLAAEALSNLMIEFGSEKPDA